MGGSGSSPGGRVSLSIVRSVVEVRLPWLLWSHSSAALQLLSLSPCSVCFGSESLAKVVEVLVKERVNTFSEAILWARMKFQEQFHDKIKQASAEPVAVPCLLALAWQACWVVWVASLQAG